MIEEPRIPAALDRRFEAAVFDWDGTAVPDRQAAAGHLRAVVEALCAAAFDVVVITGTNVDNVDGQLRARPAGPGALLLCLNRGSEVFSVGPDGPELIHRRVATPEEDAALTRAAELVVERLRDVGVEAAIVAERLNRRKIDLIPEAEWADPPKARIGELLAAVRERLGTGGLADVSDVVELAVGASREAGLADPKVTSDAKHVEIGLTDKADSAEWAFGDLWRRGIAPDDVLIAGDEFGPLGGVAGSDSLLLSPAAAASATVFTVGVEPLGVPDGVIAVPGGPDSFVALLEDQLERRARGELPHTTAVAGWSLVVDGVDPIREEVDETLLALGDGRLGTRGSLVADHEHAAAVVRVAGVYDGDGSQTMLVECPLWNRLGFALEHGDRVRRVLDLRSGLLHQELERPGEDRLRAVLLSSLARPATAVLRAEGPPVWLAAAQPLVEADGGAAPVVRESDGTAWAEVRADGSGVVAAARDGHSVDADGRAHVDRVARYLVGKPAATVRKRALRDVTGAQGAGFDRLLAEHREAWARRWDDADVEVTGDERLTREIRFALFHLMASAPDDGGPGAVGARGLTGEAYRGHVFWDTDVFVLPFLAATCPSAARAVLQYRLDSLPAARENARRLGRAGARFAWESAAHGVDVTPASVRDGAGRLVPIRTGTHEEHIVADVAWAAQTYVDWTGDEEFARGPARLLLAETARYWTSRVRRDRGGRAHIYGVIGPDEYHEPVDDNAFTNVMARWNLRAAAALDGADPAESRRWLELADALVDGYDPASGLYEQFAGFRRLEPLVVSELADRPFTADTLLGRDRVSGAQVVKQADVLMLHHLVPHAVEPGSLEPNLAFYEPRTAHGSSLSPGIHASLFARAGRLDEAVHWFRRAARLDLDDLTRTTAHGIHMATLGSLWQALAFGFAGLRPDGDALAVDPRVPTAWEALDLRVRFRGRRVRLRLAPDAVTAWADGPVRVRVGGSTVEAGPGGTAVSLGEELASQ